LLKTEEVAAKCRYGLASRPHDGQGASSRKA
jgi:hypothetical protein